MKKAELMRSIKKAKAVFGWVLDTVHDGHYIQLVKGSCIAIYKQAHLDDDFQAVLRDDGDLYIN